jgi:cytidylate kinase
MQSPGEADPTRRLRLFSCALAESVMIVTIDGPAGSGKSSAAKALAARLGFEFLDTGAMYRAVAFAALRDRVQPEDSPAFREWLKQLQIEATPGVLRLAGEDVIPFIRTPEITALASRLAAIAPVRTLLVDLQRKAAEGRNLVCEGRDQGTVVFPNAERKFFLVADPVERARRRHRELLSRGQNLTLEEVLAAQDERDRRDSERAVSPTKPAADAVILDSTILSPEEVVARMESEVRRWVS